MNNNQNKTNKRQKKPRQNGVTKEKISVKIEQIMPPKKKPKLHSDWGVRPGKHSYDRLWHVKNTAIFELQMISCCTHCSKSILSHVHLQMHVDFTYFCQPAKTDKRIEAKTSTTDGRTCKLFITFTQEVLHFKSVSCKTFRNFHWDKPMANHVYNTSYNALSTD